MHCALWFITTIKSIVMSQHSLCHHAYMLWTHYSLHTIHLHTFAQYLPESHNVTSHLSGWSQTLKGFSWNFLLLFALERTEYFSSYSKRRQVCFESFNVVIISFFNIYNIHAWERNYQLTCKWICVLVQSFTCTCIHAALAGFHTRLCHLNQPKPKTNK